ncbi:hypothetical protein HELRODRAFT_163884 [Helobdella robusta]|uniref:Uncharacterized protein n=1 Tax=Helobdella robusta TaxID=6412 RepID=T1EUK8_HELRO|nr:hypothetical protein HELRODRAFT_163884 [Helobdella robusta]ESN96768.1 hypothetical protein HELRODRAFT_163884 [Helobdella robusta]
MLLNQDWNEIRRIPSGLDKSWETRRVEGLEMMSTSLELQREKVRHSCKAPTCYHTAVNKGSLACNNKKNSSSKNHEVLATANHNQMAARTKGGSCGKNGNATDSNCQQIVKCRSLSSSKKNKLSIISSPHKHERSLTCEIFPGVGGSVVGKNANHQAATSENFEMKELEEQVIELIHQLAQHKHQARLDKLSLAKLQQELSRTISEKPMREMLKRQLEQERERREFLENKLKEMKNECCYCCPNEINVLKKENTRLNEAIQDLLPYKHRTERMQQNNSNSVNSLETEMSKLKSQLESLVQDNHLMNMEVQKLESIINKCYQCKLQMTGHIKLIETTPGKVGKIGWSIRGVYSIKQFLANMQKNLFASYITAIIEMFSIERSSNYFENVMKRVIEKILLFPIGFYLCHSLSLMAIQIHHHMKKYHKLFVKLN